MYKIKRDIQFISENSLNMKNVFLDLFRCTGKALYVQNRSAEVLGIISISDFVTSYERSGDTDCCNYNKAYKYICFDENEDVLINNAIEIFHKFEIRGSIPIKSNNVSIYGEIIEVSDVDEKNDVEKYIKEFQTYKNACYLKQEFEAMKKLLFSQKILVLGSEEQFNKKLGFLLSEHCDVALIGGGEIGYELLAGCPCLLVDVTDEYPLRRELYNHFGFGMMWDDFLCDLGRRIREKRLNQYMFLTDIQKNHDFVIYLQNYYKYVVYDCKQNIEDIYILKALELAGVEITRENHLKKKWGCLFGYQSHGRLQQGENVLGQALWFYRNEMDWREISKTYGDRALNYYMGKGIKLYDVEKKSFESIEFYNNISNDWIPVLPTLRDEPEGDTQRFQDCCNGQVTYENGLRKTLYQPPYYYGTVYCIGLCTMYGVYVKDEDTIPSYIQKEINKRMIPYRVVNLGYYVECSLDLRRFKIEEQDIIVVLHIDIYPEMENGLNYIDISERMEKLHTEIFFGNMYAHVNTAGSRAYAQSMMPEILKAVRSTDAAKLKKNNPFDLYKPIPFAYPQRQIMEKTLKAMALGSSSWKKTEKIGAIVMNANPFTRGHLYLVEQAFLRVTYLYLFVVEENQSAFTFTERFDMVMRGVEAFKDKVAVVPSGMIAGELFFPDYFNPAKNDITSSISTVTDHVLFSKYYAKYGNITYRFVGTEDGDNTTAQYNRDMKYVLPYFGIEVVEIDRARDERGREFRAGIVRKAMKEGKLDHAEWVIPKTTYLYLKEKHLDEKWYSSKKSEDDARAQ